MNNLFKDKDGNLVQIHSVQFAAQGGGPLLTVSGDQFAETFEPAEWPGYHLVSVTGDWLPEGTKIPAYWNGTYWNGWVTPMFTGAGIALLAALMPDTVSFDGAEGGVLAVHDDDEGDSDMLVIDPEEILVDGQPVKVWYIDGWCWDLAE